MHNDGQVFSPSTLLVDYYEVVNELLLPWIGNHMGVAGSVLHLDEQQGNMWSIRF